MGAAQLSLALVADALCDDELALRPYQDFKFKVRLPDEFDLIADHTPDSSPSWRTSPDVSEGTPSPARDIGSEQSGSLLGEWPRPDRQKIQTLSPV